MLYSSLRKRAVSGWLKENYSQGFSSPLKLQKYLFFYEMLSKVDDDNSEFNYLRGYENGPVFSDVYGDYFYRKSEFINDVETTYYSNPEIVNEERAKFSSFLVNILNEEELSDLTHELNIWKTKEDEIKKGIKQVPLYEEDLTSDDVEMLKTLKETYSAEYIDSVEVIELYNKNFIINKDDLSKLTEDQQNALITLSSNEELENPVYITLSEDGVLLVD